ncbi:hypothetical protein ACIQGZ_17560 [Streptomyces sp. NPDC092296]|uniref:hypothetical protein n=1 Tax=Streptomyces sp. NPDC092296 TaxID=3366012 RepID=UPI003829AA4B
MVIHIKRDAYLKLADAAGHQTIEDRARAAGIGFGTAWRISTGATESVSASTIANLLGTYPATFYELFEIQPVVRAAA